jgi:hypothetical protein
MFAYLVAGLVVAGLMRFLHRVAGDPPFVVQLGVGAVAAGIGGLLLNLLVGEDFLAVDAWGFTAAVLAAVVALAFVQARTSGRAVGETTETDDRR